MPLVAPLATSNPKALTKNRLLVFIGRRPVCCRLAIRLLQSTARIGFLVASVLELHLVLKLLQVARPQFLMASVALFALGALWAALLGAPLVVPRLLLAYLIVLPAHISLSYSNDYFDVDADRFAVPTLLSGGSGILVKQPALRRPARLVALALIGSSLVLAVLFLLLYTYPLWFLGYVLAGNLVGWYYAAPPLRLSYRGLGELSTAFSAGLLIPGMGYLAARGFLEARALLLAIPLIVYGVVFIIAVEIPDEEADRAGHKLTWVVRRGRKFGFAATGLAAIIATAYFVGLGSLGALPRLIDFRLLSSFSLLPLVAGIWGLLRRPTERAPATRLVYGIVFALAAFFILTDGYLLYLVLTVP